MKLRNKKTGEIVEPCGINLINGRAFVRFDDEKGTFKFEAHSLAELNAEWEDITEEPKESKEPKKYWFINSGGETVSYYEDDEEPEDTNACKEIGNYFETKEEAEAAVEKLKAWKRLRDNGFKIKGWKFTPDMKQIEGNYVKIEAEVPQILINEKDIDLLFGGKA